MKVLFYFADIFCQFFFMLKQFFDVDKSIWRYKGKFVWITCFTFSTFLIGFAVWKMNGIVPLCMGVKNCCEYIVNKVWGKNDYVLFAMQFRVWCVWHSDVDLSAFSSEPFTWHLWIEKGVWVWFAVVQNISIQNKIPIRLFEKYFFHVVRRASVLALFRFSSEMRFFGKGTDYMYNMHIQRDWVYTFYCFRVRL